MERTNLRIPKKIHFCWMSGEPYPAEVQACIDSWKHFMPDYEIKLWNSENFDVNICQYTKEAMECKKYAFVSDYIRLYALYHEGGIYFDSDVKALRSFDPLLNEPAFLGYESGGRLGPWLIASTKGNTLIKELLDYYSGRSFYKESGEMNLTPNTVPVTNALTAHGLLPDNKIQKLKNITILPEDYFCPKNPWTGKITMTPNTYAMHLFMGAWNDTADSDLPFISTIDVKVQNFIHKLLGRDRKVIVYGLGVVGRNVLDQLAQFDDIEVECILVTRRDNNWKSVNGIPIIETKHSDSIRRDIPVLVSTIPKYYEDIEKTLTENGYHQIYFLGE